MLKRVLRSRRGEGYIDVCVLVICAMLVIALAVKIMPVYIAKQQLDTFATELVREAELYGRVGTETTRRAQSLREQTGLDPDISWSSTGRIQLNQEITVVLTYETNLGLFAGFGSFPITLRSEATGKVRCIGMSRFKQAIRDRRGISFPLIIAVTLSLVILLCGVSEYLRLLIVAQGVRDAVQEAVISTVNDNYDDVYHGVREGYSGAYQPMAGDFEESLDYGDIYGRLDALLNLTNQSGYHVQYTEDGKMEFRVWDLSVDLQNASFASADSAGNRLIADCEIELEVPVSFGGRLLPPMRMTVKVSAGYTPRF